MDNHPTKLAFSQNLQTMFHLDHGGKQPVPLKLIELQDGCVSPGQGEFSLLFHGPNDFVLPGQTYQLRHEQIGEFNLFLVPLSRDQNGFYYEAVLHRAVHS